MSEACITEIMKAFPKLSETNVREIYEDVIRRKRRLLGENPLMGDAEAAVKAAKEKSAEEKFAAIIEKRSRAINVLRRQANHDYIQSSFPKKEADGIQALIVGVGGKEQGAAFSLDAQAKGLGLGYLGPMVTELRREGVLGMLGESAIIRAGQSIGLFKERLSRFHQFERNVASELERIDDPTKLAATGDRQAEATARIVHKYQELARTQQNDAGAWIRKLPGYITRQSHDQFRILKAGADKWIADIAPMLDERTFDDVPDADRGQFMKDVWRALASGVHEKPGGDWLGGFKGPGNLAKRLSAERVLIFKPGKWFDYNDAYGTGSFLESVLHGFMRAGRNLAALRTFGTNPEAAFTKLRDDMAARAIKRDDFKEADRIMGKSALSGGNYLKNQFDSAMGYLGIPESPTFARAMANVRGILTMAKLGAVVLSSLPDIVNVAGVLKHNGYSALERYQRAIFGTLLRGPLNAEQREVVDLWGTALDGVMGGMAARFNATDHFAGKMTKLQDIFFRANGLGFWMDRMKEGASLALARRLAMDATKEHGALDPYLQTTLGRYGIAGREWDLIRRQVAKTPDEGDAFTAGKEFITPDAIERIPDEEMKTYLGKPDASPEALDRARFDLLAKMRTYFVEQTRDALTEPGAMERAALTKGTVPGSLHGEFWRSLTLFRTFSYTFVRRNLGREFLQAPNKVGGMVNVAKLIAGTTILGLLSNTAKDLAKGRTPRDPTQDPLGVGTAAMLTGGGLGIYGDFLFGTSNRFGQSLLETAAGPLFGVVSDMKAILDASAGNIMGNKQGDPLALGYRFIWNNAPFVNLFYTRLAMDYLFNWQLQEMISPGFLRRYERQLKKQNNQQFMIAPSSVIPHGGGNRIFEGVR